MAVAATDTFGVAAVAGTGFAVAGEAILCGVCCRDCCDVDVGVCEECLTGGGGGGGGGFIGEELLDNGSGAGETAVFECECPLGSGRREDTKDVGGGGGRGEGRDRAGPRGSGGERDIVFAPLRLAYGWMTEWMGACVYAGRANTRKRAGRQAGWMTGTREAKASPHQEQKPNTE